MKRRHEIDKVFCGGLAQNPNGADRRYVERFCKQTTARVVDKKVVDLSFPGENDRFVFAGPQPREPLFGNCFIQWMV